MQPSSFFGLSVVALLMLVWPLVAHAGDRQWVVDQRGERVGYLEPAPLSDSPLVIRDRDGRTVGMIERHELDNGHVIRDRHGGQLGHVEGYEDGQGERGQRRDWRDGPRKRWGAHADRW